MDDKGLGTKHFHEKLESDKRQRHQNNNWYRKNTKMAQSL